MFRKEIATNVRVIGSQRTYLIKTDGRRLDSTYVYLIRCAAEEIEPY